MKPKSVKLHHWIRYNFYFVLQHFVGVNNTQQLFKNFNYKLTKELSNGLPTNSSLKLKEYEKENIVELNNEPVLYKNAAKGWKAYDKWSLDFFSEKYGDRKVLINNTKGIVDPNAPQKLEEIELKDYIKELKQGTLKYLKLSNLAQKEAALQNDLELKWLKKFKKPLSFGETYYMFIGGKNTSTPMHNEFPTTVYVQISGKKKWVLYNTCDRMFLNAKTERRTYFFSDYNPTKPTNEGFPLSKHARKYEVTLEPGDVIVVPPFTWHYVSNMTDSIGVAYKFANIYESFKSSKLLTALFFLSTRPNIFYSFFASRVKKDDYVLMKK